MRSSPQVYRFPFLEGTGRAAGPGRFGAALLRGAGFPLFLAAPAEPTLERPDLGGFPGFAGGAPWLPFFGEMARIRHLGPEPIKSSLWAASKASRTR